MRRHCWRSRCWLFVHGIPGPSKLALTKPVALRTSVWVGDGAGRPTSPTVSAPSVKSWQAISELGAPTPIPPTAYVQGRPDKARSGWLPGPDFQGQPSRRREVHQRIEGELAELAPQQVVQAGSGDRKPHRRRPCGTVLGNPRLRAGAPEYARAAAAAKSAQARARAADVLPPLDAACRAGTRTLYESAEALTNRDAPTPAAKGSWRPEQVRSYVATAIDVLGVVRGGRL